MNIADILFLKFKEECENELIKLQDDGNGPYIKNWAVPNVNKPTALDIGTWAVELDLQIRQKKAVEQRRYPPITEQLDMLYHDAKNGTTKWVETIEAVKAAHPKPNQ